MTEFLWYSGIPGRERCRFVRKKVFVEEQGFSEELEFDEIDVTAWHLSVVEHGVPVGAARLYGQNAVYHAGRICILPEYRKCGLGGQILSALEKKAIELGGQLSLIHI